MKGWEDGWTAQQLRRLSSPHQCPCPCPGFQQLLGGQVALVPSRLAGFGGAEGLSPSHWLCSVAAAVNGICSA